ncbi:MAG: tetratricopeptide repeat protein [Hyphomicrobiales bacterium]|nr:tetratricopeptide repeat protein [Hyphomicrobiales bacterium]MBV9751279.1 tetratricopeptide repeat protein [Hyphomicrobiales bacterium]
MSDIFREVDEDVRRDRFERIWKQYGNLIVAAALVVVAAVGGWEIFGHFRLKQAQRASAKFETAVELSEKGKDGDAERLLASIVKKGPSGYAALARFREAAETGKRDPAAGAALYDTLAADSALGTALQGLAQLRAAMLLSDKLPPDELKKRLEPLAQGSSPWRNLARELLGLAELKGGDYEAAGRYFDEIITDPETPPGLRQRVEIYLGLVKAGPLPAKS